MVDTLKIIREPGVRRVVTQGGLESVRCCAAFRDEPADRHPAAGDDHSLAMLDGIEDVGEAPCR